MRRRLEARSLPNIPERSQAMQAKWVCAAKTADGLPALARLISAAPEDRTLQLLRTVDQGGVVAKAREK